MTFTIAVVDPARGLLGAATASRSLAVGNAVLAVDPAHGISVSQAWTNRMLRGALLSGLQRGAADPGQSLEAALAADRYPDFRQCGVIDLAGRVAGHTGPRTTGWAGHQVITGDPAGAAVADVPAAAESPRLAVLVLGNCLAGPAVLQEMAESLRPTISGVELARFLVDAVLAGDAAGGDVRGRQSAAVVVGQIDPWATWPFLYDVDLRVDDHPEAPAVLSALVDEQIAGAQRAEESAVRLFESTAAPGLSESPEEPPPGGVPAPEVRPGGMLQIGADGQEAERSWRPPEGKETGTARAPGLPEDRALQRRADRRSRRSRCDPRRE